ncbi:retrotransposon hot spot (RHS) protein, partial [Trypanosoma conorhini]
MGARRIVMDCPDESDVTAMGAWEVRECPAEEKAKYWEGVQKGMALVGPNRRNVLDGRWHKLASRLEGAMGRLTAWAVNCHVGLDKTDLWCCRVPAEDSSTMGPGGDGAGDGVLPERPGFCRGQGRSVGARDEGDADARRLHDGADAPSCAAAVRRAGARSRRVHVPGLCEQGAAQAARAAAPDGTRATPLPAANEPAAVPHRRGRTATECAPSREGGRKLPGAVRAGVENFPPVGAFFFVEAPRRTTVGLQTTTAKASHVVSS